MKLFGKLNGELKEVSARHDGLFGVRPLLEPRVQGSKTSLEGLLEGVDLVPQKLRPNDGLHIRRGCPDFGGLLTFLAL